MATLKMHRQLISGLSSECVRRAKSPVGLDACHGLRVCVSIPEPGETWEEKDP